MEVYEKNYEYNKSLKRSTTEELKSTLLIDNKSEYNLNLFSLLNKVNSNKNNPSERKENEYILNLLLMSPKLNKQNKLICLLLVFFLNQEDKNIDFINYLYLKIRKLYVKQEKKPYFDDYLKDPSFIQYKTNIFYSMKYIMQIKKMLNNKCDLDLLTNIENLYREINKNIIAYLDKSKNKFLERSFMNDDTSNRLKTLIYQLCEDKNEISENSSIYLINKNWVFRAKLFIDPFISARKDNMEHLLLDEYFVQNKVFESFIGKKDNKTPKNYFGIVYPGPINNYEIMDCKDCWIDPINIQENEFLKNNLIENKDYSLIEEKDWIFLKDIFDATNEIKKKKKDDNVYQNKILIIDQKLKENKNLLKKKFIQINSESTIKDFKNKIIRCLNFEINKTNFNFDKLYENNDVLFYCANKQNKDLLIEICISFVHKNKFYDSLYIQEIKFNSDNELIKDIFNGYDKNNYFLIAEIIDKNSVKKFIHPINPENNNSNIYNCAICGEQLNLIEKYNCDLCNLSLFCSNQCADISGEHHTLHESLNNIYIKKFELKSFLEEEINATPDDLHGVVGLDKDKNYSCINSIIHCLSNNVNLTKYFINDFYIKDININDFLNTKDILVSRYNNLIREMWLGDKNSKKIEVYHKNFVKLLLNLLKYDFNDNASMNNMNEILVFLLNYLHKELNRYINNENIKEKDEGETDNNIINTNIKKDDSIITDLFQGIYQSSLSCSKCGNVSMIYDFFKYILLPIPKKNNNLIIKYFNQFECKYMRYVMEDNSTIKNLKDKAIKNISDKIKHIIHIMSLTELIDVTAFDFEDEKILTYTTIYNSIELVQFDKNKILTKVYLTQIKPDQSNEKKDYDDDNIDIFNKIENNDFDLQLNKIFKDNKENDVELVFYEKSVVERNCINIYVYPYIYNEKDKLNKNRDNLFNVYPIAISVKTSLILKNFEYLVNVKLRELLIDHFKEESEKRGTNYIELVYPHFFYNCSNYSQTNCFLCKERKKNNLFCSLFSAIDKEKSINDLINLFDYPKQPIFLLAKCKYYNNKKQIYSNMDSFPTDNLKKKPSENKIDICDCFELYTKKEEIVGIDWHCESCNSFQIAQKQLLIYKPPLYLILQLDRIQLKKVSNFWNNYGIDDTMINFPINNLDLSEYVEGPEKNKAKYNLIGAIYREVSVRNDYIYSVCKNNKKWYMYKDSKVSSTNSIVNKNAHFLFYKRKDVLD